MTRRAAGHRGIRSLRILVVNWQDRENPLSGGAETHLHEIFGRLADRGHQVTLLVSGWPGCTPRVSLDGLDVHRTGGRHTFSLAAPRYFRRHLSTMPCDVVVEDLNKVPLFTPWWTSAPVALVVHHLFGATAFQEASFPVALATWLLERPVPRVFHEAPVAVVSESTRDDLVARGMSAERMDVVRNGVDLEAYAPDPGGERFPRPTVLYLGRVKRYKRVDLVIRAVELLVRQGKDLRLLIAGKGDHVDTLKALVSKLGLEHHVEFLGFVSDAEKASLFRQAWVHALTSPKEGWGIANMEAAACGTCTVASDAPGLRDSVVDGRTGFLVRHGDVAALASALGRVLENPELRNRLGREARTFAEEHSWDASATAMERFLSRVVDDSPLG
ncbi:MAG: glycosyltransferase family 4 protein [Gemmatimonadetes bacterium]|nr:glycosyltransferase family 4 protein [Gemmatimonadota bacterium]